jgi:hypothetical protein
MAQSEYLAIKMHCFFRHLLVLLEWSVEHESNCLLTMTMPTLHEREDLLLGSESTPVLLPFDGTMLATLASISAFSGMGHVQSTSFPSSASLNRYTNLIV